MISIIIPCYNCEKYIKRAIESVLLQTYQDWELLLVNNNSSDSTQLILEEYQKQIPSKISIYQELKKGASAARNKGLYNAKGNWIQYLDADDELMPDKLNRQINILNKGDFDILAGCFIWVKKEKGKTFRITVKPDNKDIWLSLVSTRLGRTSANLWRKAVLLNIEGWDEKLSSSQEYNLLFRLLKNNAKIFFDTEQSAIIYTVENSISISTDKKRDAQILENWLNLRLQIKEYLKQTGQLTELMKRKIDDIIFNLLKDRKNLSPALNNQLKTIDLTSPLWFKIKRNCNFWINKVIRKVKFIYATGVLR